VHQPTFEGSRAKMSFNMLFKGLDVFITQQKGRWIDVWGRQGSMYPKKSNKLTLPDPESLMQGM
jgi:hypothetical protein